MHETLIKRTVWVAECDCTEDSETSDKFRRIYDHNPPREVQCPHCRKWIEPKEVSYTGKDKFNS